MTLVSDNIRYLRKLNGLTQEQFSRKINIKRSLLGAYEEGRANPNQQNIQAIAKSFNTTVELLTRQDLRKLRETPSLSIPLGQSSRTTDSSARPSAIRSDGKLAGEEDDPFQHPDFPDIFAESTPPGADRADEGAAARSAGLPRPQPLSSVLNKYYQSPDESAVSRSAPVPPVITSPVRPDTGRVADERPQTTTFQPVTASSPVDRLFGQQPDRRTADRRTADRTAEHQPADRQTADRQPADNQPPDRQPAARLPTLLTFNNVYEGPGSSARSVSAQAVTPTIPVVMQPQFAEYGQRYQQADYVHRLPAMHLPTLPEGHYRAFEAGDDFVFPGALLVGQFVRNWFEIADGKTYVLLLSRDRSDMAGIHCRRVYNQVKVKGTLLLTADRADVQNREVALKDVLEVWEIRAFVSQQLPPPAPNTERLRQLVDELRFEVGRL